MRKIGIVMKRLEPSDIVEKYVPEKEVDRAIRFWEGEGYHLVTRDDRSQTGATLCKHCLGTGEFAGAECEVCGGSGEVEGERAPQWWGIEKCCEALMDSPKADEIDGLIWDLRGAVFFELKRLGKFDEDAEGPDNQAYVDRVMRDLVGMI